MSLKEAVLEIVDQMDVDAHWQSVLKPYASMLRIACKAAGDVVPSRSLDVPATLLQREVEAEKRKAERQVQEQRVIAQRDEQGERHVLCVDGPADGLMVPIPGGMPVGAKTRIEGAVYQLRQDGKLRPA